MKKAVNVILKTIAALLLISMLLFLVVWFSVVDMFYMGKLRLSLLNDQRCKQFVLDQGIAIPEEFSEFNFQWLFAYIEENPDVSNFGVSWPALEEFSETIRDVVIKYYGIEP